MFFSFNLLSYEKPRPREALNSQMDKSPNDTNLVPKSCGAEQNDQYDGLCVERASECIGVRHLLLSDVLSHVSQASESKEADEKQKRVHEPKFFTWRENRKQSSKGFAKRQNQQVDDVRCMFNLSSNKNFPRPVMQQDGGLQESTVTPHIADQLLLDLQQLGLVRAKGGPEKGEAERDVRTDPEPILKDLKLVQECPFERPVFHCFLKELSINQDIVTCLVTVEQHEEAYVMMAYNEPVEGLPIKPLSELARFPKFPQLTDGFCMSANGDSVVFTCTLLGCLLHVSLYSCLMDADAAAASIAPEYEVGGTGYAQCEPNQANSKSASRRKQNRDNISRESSQSLTAAVTLDHVFRFRKDRPVVVVESNYKFSEPISEHVYDVCIREMSSSGSNKCNLYVTNKSNIAVVSLSSLKLENFLFEGLKLPWRLKLHKHLLIIAEKWGSIQIADLEKEHRSLCVKDMQGLYCENGLKAIEVVTENNMLLLTVYPEGNQLAGRQSEELRTTNTPADATSGAAATGGAGKPGSGQAAGNNIIGGLGSLGSRNWLSQGGEGGEDASWSCHCFHFNPETKHGNPMLCYAQTLRLNRAPLSCTYSPLTKHLYILCFYPARNNSTLLMMNLEVIHKEHGRALRISANPMLPQKDEAVYKAALEGIRRRPAANQEVLKSVEMVDSSGLPVVVAMKRPANFGFM